MNNPSPHRPLVLLELNEINFEIVRQYIAAEPTLFPSLRKLLAGAMVRTEAEQKYEQLEPWIQWVSVHSGLSLEQHGIFRLGDIAGSDVPQFYEALERRGVKVGCISPMNAENRLRTPGYFLPDPWTSTSTDGSWWSRQLHAAIAQAVNDNAQAKVTLRSKLALALGLLRFARVRHYGTYLRLLRDARSSPWSKALFLDLFLHDLHMTLLRSRRPGFSSLFLNAGAHIQHHYFLCAQPVRKSTGLQNPEWYVARDADPVKDMLAFYDRIVGDYLGLDGVELIVATGLSQAPHPRMVYYYRLKDHAAFLRQIGIDCVAVHPRMTRDFLVDFADGVAMERACTRRKAIGVEQDGLPLFGEIEQREHSAFVTMTYPNEVLPDTRIVVDGRSLTLQEHVSFVAVKNGMHRSEGYAFFSAGAAPFAPADRQHVKELNRSVMGYFGALADIEAGHRA